MALKQTVLAHGTVVRVNSREVTTKDGRDFVFTNAVIVGEHTMLDVRVPDSLVLDLRSYVGETITATVELSSYRDDVEASLLDVLTVSQALDLEPAEV